VILFDPIFQGLAISLMAGEVASLLLSRVTVPVLYFMSERRKHEKAPNIDSPNPTTPRGPRERESVEQHEEPTLA
jgi:hypothetical protein